MKDMDFYKEEPTPNSGISTYSHRSVTHGELDLIVEIINGCHELQQGSLPGPPPPPSPDPYCQSLLNQNNIPPQQNPQSTSKPVLVPRGTAPRSRPLSEMASAHSSHLSGPPTCSTGRGRGPSCSLTTKGSVPSQGLQSNANVLEQILEKPRLVVVEEPKDRGMRFRYECEGRSAGSILGASSTDNNKTQPTIEIQGPINHLKKVTVTVSLVTKDLPHRPHPHCLILHSTFSPSPSAGHTKGIEDMDMNAVRLEGSWKANGEFAQTDVHRQIAIVFKTPPYQDQDITEEVEVSIVLRRVSDQMESEPVSFTYLPYNPEQTFNFHVMPSDESQHPIMPAAEMGLLDPSSIDEQIVFSELLHFLSEQNLPADMDTNSAVFPITNMNFNANYNTCPQDFSQFNDIQFNMLFNDNQIAQSEPQDSVIQVKAEEEL
ncbi:hypothetical protein GOODEAATRI_006167 [Goodea atripinnis]|uniref:RHD domain-containing protein n=1 Tax=Goodea atripinnis TaxID=208336 RepID=A0ABV0P4Q8_9TELE